MSLLQTRPLECPEKNALESYAYILRNFLADEKLAEKLDAADKPKKETAVNETIKWLKTSQGSEEDYKENRKEIEAIAKYVSFS